MEDVVCAAGDAKGLHPAPIVCACCFLPVVEKATVLGLRFLEDIENSRRGFPPVKMGKAFDNA